MAPAPEAGVVDTSADDALADAEAPEPDGTPDAAEEPAPELPPLSVLIEDPYKLYERKRPKGEVDAAGADERLARWNQGGTGDPSFISNRQSYHPGARVVVDVRLLAGSLPARRPRDRRTGKPRKVLSEHDVLARSRKYGYWPFRLCFEEGLRQDKDQTIHGETRVQIRVNAAGKVTRQRLVKSKLPKAVAECLRDRAGALEFLPAPRQSLSVELQIKLWPGDARVPLIGARNDEPFDNPGKLDVEAILAVGDTLKPDIEACYRAGVSRDPGLWGRLQLRFDVDEKGRLKRVREDESRFPDHDVSKCIVSAAQAAHFSPPKQGALSFVLGIRLGEMPLNDENH